MADSEIVNFYTNKVVFLTGGTGFLGKLTLERLLRVCCVRLVYILVRQKKNKTEEERYNELFDQPVFDRLKNECPDYKQHIRMITGDCRDHNLGISRENWTLLHKEVEVVLHCAATVRFNQNLRTAFQINVRAVRDLIENAKRMKKLKSFVHVSTAYSNCVNPIVEEIIYPPPMTADQLETLLETFPDDKFVADMEKSILQDIPNTYTFTKNVAEDLVSRMVKESTQPLPIAIVRPSMILSTYKEPIVGWIDNIYGPMGVAQVVAVGLLHTLLCNPVNKGDMVPADYVVNAILAVAYDTADKETKINQNLSNNDSLEVYNYSSWRNSITWSEWMHLLLEKGKTIPPMTTICVQFLFLTRFVFVNNLLWFILHTIPAHIVDIGLRIIGKRPMLVEGYQKLRTFVDVISYFTNREWKMPHRNILTLYERLNVTDKKLFELRMSTFDWHSFAYDFLLNGRTYVLKEPVSNLEEARKRFRKIRICYYFVKTLLLIFGVYCLNFLFSIFGLNLF